jgi:leucyl/phenylalanyl-tRNA--protein transferase
MIARLDDRLWFPTLDPAQRPDISLQGLVAVGGDLRPERLLLAYRSGAFPWSENPITWWSPDPRAILELESLHIPRSLKRTLRQERYRVTYDQAFRRVIEACAKRTRSREQTWLTQSFIEAYSKLHTAGWAHSVEAWDGEELVGGVYGVLIGRLFAGESMFYRAPDASKVALVKLVERLRTLGCQLFDLQMLTPVTLALGGSHIPRASYLERLRAVVTTDGDLPPVGWR